MQNILLLYDNQADIASLSGGHWLPALPLANLKSRPLHRVARSVDLDLTSTRFNIDMVSPYEARAICVGPGNLSSGYSYRFTVYSDIERTDLVFDSGWSVGAPRAAWNTLNWTDPAFWTGLLPWADNERSPWIIHVFAEPVIGQYWTLEIDDTSNADGHVQLGRLFMGKAWQPSINYGYGNNGLSFRDNSIRAQTLSGGEKSWRRLNPRIFQFGFDYLPEAEMYGAGYDFQRAVGFDGEVFVIPDPAGAQFLHKRSFLANVTRLDALSQAIFAHGSTAFELKEII